MNQSMICWKWDDASLTDDLLEKAKDLTCRFGADTVCVAAHWVTKPFDDDALVERFRQCADYLHGFGKKLCVEACIRNEGEGFFKKYPNDRAWLAHMVEAELDEYGSARIELDIEPVYHYWRISGQQGPDKIFGAWALTKAGDAQYVANSCADISGCVKINITQGQPSDVCRQVNFGGEIKEDQIGVSNILEIHAGSQHKGKTAVVVVGTPQPIPDLASFHLIEYYREMLQAAKQAGVDGVFSDEWGYDVILKIIEFNPYYDNNLFLRHLSLSDAMAVRYAQRFENNRLYEDLLHLFYAPDNCERLRVGAINRYIANLRAIMADNDSAMYGAMKEILGGDKFYGIHPTWWGSPDSLNFEIFKNGFYWWEAKRDIAQTDEMVILPIRTALTHKWGGGFWYNMWYSMGTLDIKTYFRESWNNLRYGGRTHHHGYECPNEGVVLELRKEGLLEQLEAMDSRIRMIEPYQITPPDSRVLVLFGMEAVSNWRLCGRPHPNWAPQNVNLDLVLNTAARLYDTLIFDLVPTTEIANQSLKVQDGKAVYGTQVYDTVVLLMPESMDRSCFAFLQSLPQDKLLIYGSAAIYNDGSSLSEADGRWLVRQTRAAHVPEAAALAEAILSTGAAPNRYDNGCVFQDGSAVFTGDGNLNRGNPLHVDCMLSGRHVTFTGEDFLFIHILDGRIKTCTPTAGVLTVDGIEINLTGGAAAEIN